MSRSTKDRNMTYWTAALLGLALAASPVAAKTKPVPVEGQTPQQPIETGNYPYQLFVPKGYLTDTAKQYPLLIFLHGSGERGDDVAKTYRIDPARMYLTGLSRGGHASWRWAIAEPKRFAAVAAVAGRGNPGEACRLMDLPVWAFHGDRDDVVVPEGSFAMARAIRACGGRKVRLTIYPDLGHNAWDPAYDDPALYAWLLEQTLSSPTIADKDKK